MMVLLLMLITINILCPIGINDGAAAVVLVSEDSLQSLQCATPLARVVSWAQAGVDPSIMGMGPVTAVNKAVS